MKWFNNLSIKSKLSITFTIVGILIAIIGISIVYYLIFQSLNKVEDYYLESELYSVKSTLSMKIGNLFDNVKDYATLKYVNIYKRNEIERRSL